MDISLHSSLDALVKKHIEVGTFDTVAIAVADTKNTTFLNYGKPFPTSSCSTTQDSIFDLASLSKIVLTWPSICHLIETGSISLDTTLDEIFLLASGQPTGKLTIRQLLTHTAGLPSRSRLIQYGKLSHEIFDGVLSEELEELPGKAVRYTDRAALILGYVCEKTAGHSLDQVAKKTWDHLGLEGFEFGPIARSMLKKTIPGGFDDHSGVLWHGVVHDMSTRLLGGCSGIAGCFGSSKQISDFLSSIYEKYQCGSKTSVWRQSLINQTVVQNSNRGFFWITSKNGVCYHYGFTGGGIWLHPETGQHLVILTNRLVLNRDPTNISRFRSDVGEILNAHW